MKSFAASPGDINSAGLGGKRLARHQQPLKVEVLALLSLPQLVPHLGSKHGALTLTLFVQGSCVSIEGKTDGP